MECYTAPLALYTFDRCLFASEEILSLWRHRLSLITAIYVSLHVSTISYLVLSLNVIGEFQNVAPCNVRPTDSFRLLLPKEIDIALQGYEGAVFTTFRWTHSDPAARYLAIVVSMAASIAIINLALSGKPYPITLCVKLTSSSYLSFTGVCYESQEPSDTSARIRSLPWSNSLRGGKHSHLEYSLSMWSTFHEVWSSGLRASVPGPNMCVIEPTPIEDSKEMFVGFKYTILVF